ncbi:MAG: hypothetical protein K9I85_10140 [Saprospiraceae bacterium]|nr:hypothetical protein [Saprospiraceae bacterium]
MADLATNEGRIEGIFVIISFLMISSTDIFLFFMLFVSACTRPDQKTLGIMDVRCMGIPAVPEWALDKVEDELRQGTPFHLQRIQPPAQSQRLARPTGRSRNRILQAGEHHQVDLVFDGSIERISDRLLIGWRLVIIADPTHEYVWVKDFSYEPDRLEELIRLSLRQFLDQLRASKGLHIPNSPT